MKKLLATFLFFALLTSAQAQKSKTTLQAEIATSLASGSGITAATLRSVLDDMVVSWIDLLGATGTATGVLNNSPSLTTPTIATPTINGGVLSNITLGIVGTPSLTVNGINETLPAQPATLAAINLANTFTATQTFNTVIGATRTQTGTTDTLLPSDCGEEIIYTNTATVTVTIPATLPVPCFIAQYQHGTGKVVNNGSAVATATLHSFHGYTGTAGQYAIIGINIPTTSIAILTGDGS